MRVSKEPAKSQTGKPDEGERDELAEFLKLAHRLVKVPKTEIDEARSNGSEPQTD